MIAPRSVPLGDLPVFGRTNTDEAPKVLALHGWGRTSRDFDWLLTSDIPAIAVDLPGFGQTPLPSSQWGTPEYTDAVIAAIDSRGWTDLVLVGHSRGGVVAALLAEQRPDLVHGLVLTGAPLVRPSWSAPKKKAPPTFRIAKLLNKLKIVPDSVMQKQRRNHGSADYRAASETLRPVLVRMVNENYDNALRSLGLQQLPVALVWGGNDTAASTAQVERLAEILHPVLVTVVEGKGHDTVNQLQPELLAAIEKVLAESTA